MLRIGQILILAGTKQVMDFRQIYTLMSRNLQSRLQVKLREYEYRFCEYEYE